MYEPFGFDFYAWWAGLNPAYRYGVAILVLATSALLWWTGFGDPWFSGALAAAGSLLLLFAGGRDD